MAVSCCLWWWMCLNLHWNTQMAPDVFWTLVHSEQSLMCGVTCTQNWFPNRMDIMCQEYLPTSNKCAVTGRHNISTLDKFTKPVSSNLATANNDGSWNKHNSNIISREILIYMKGFWLDTCIFLKSLILQVWLNTVLPKRSKSLI